ncbi:transcriptional regulatory protein SrrA [Clostridium acetireducens DSM 10703]|jgi:DNA-binding response OmpR family regulator|uniref:Stage 0 sporulation protein A homolog n=1 Tax=Clostridium acetireducens DSM 10703 TaxID=1121290 RepID=A0A1E8F013_9CLOT|nr:response regulator transcription factor [Clostridium acetireducens]OFI06712.1 transcriptional regulatory protein SrrA [Clostridium acetireducens DSM 10703]
MQKSILIVDDDKEIVNLIEIYLINEGYKIYKSFNGEDALKIISSIDINLIILDIMMPKVDGIEVCKKVREKLNVPIIMLSAKNQDIDKINGLLYGADDYMIKPFNPLELVVRIKTIFRRIYEFDKNDKDIIDKDTLVVGPVKIIKSTHKVTAYNKVINLTSTEFEILYLLASNPERVFSAEEIFERVWKQKYYQSNNTVMAHISKLRDKLDNALDGEKLIHTVWGVGYKIEDKNYL